MMKKLVYSLLSLALLPATGGLAQDQVTGQPDGGNVSLKLELERSIAKGVRWLRENQDAETGAWSEKTLPAFTALAISATLGDPNLNPEDGIPPHIEKGYDFLLSNVKSDGGIYGKGLATYNTSLSIMALLQGGKEEYLPVVAKARRLLINQQQDYDKRGEPDNLFDGGVGYGGSYAHSDLSNTRFALEALYYSKKALSDTEYDESDEFDLDWDAAIEFVSACQNSEKTIERLGETTALRDEDKGGFVYFPGSTKSDVITIEADGKKKTALRSYGSISYAGLLSFIYADLDRDDPRLVAVMEWLSKNFTLEENPGMDAQGLYYYYHTMAKALATAGVDRLVTPGGQEINWKQDLALKVMSTQRPDGAWINEGSNRWLEDDPALVTAYSLLTLQQVHRNL
ncbi:MAG: terpene cyclase/mutase family protein [Verrucomicrobiales bacterium]|nr:terpene cyclase/mutase family protein [Verrucomicrobiales bacterium]